MNINLLSSAKTALRNAKRAAFVVVFAAICAVSGLAQDEPQTPKTLFTYPQCPDTITSMENRFNFVVQHFWDNCDLSKPIKDTELFYQAFTDYAQFFTHCHKAYALTSIRDLLFKARSNVKNFEQLIGMAEIAFWTPYSQYMSDMAYTEFAQAAVANKQVNPELREHCQKTLDRIKATPDSVYMGEMEYADVDGKKHKIKDIEAKSLLIFINSDEKCSIERVRLSTSSNLNRLIEMGYIKVLCLCNDKYSREWAHNAESYPDNWIVAACPEFAEKYDVRLLPGFFQLDADKKMLSKNLDFNQTKDYFDNLKF